MKYLSNVCRTLEMPLINCEINLILTWSDNFVLSNAAAQAIIFAITDTKLHIPIATVSNQDNAKYCIDWNQFLKEQLAGTNINQNWQYKRKTHI